MRGEYTNIDVTRILLALLAFILAPSKNDPTYDPEVCEVKLTTVGLTDFISFDTTGGSRGRIGGSHPPNFWKSF